MWLHASRTARASVCARTRLFYTSAQAAASPQSPPAPLSSQSPPPPQFQHTNRGDKHDVLDSMLRVDHAGEYGAVRIYEGQIAVLGASHIGAKLRVRGA